MTRRMLSLCSYRVVCFLAVAFTIAAFVCGINILMRNVGKLLSHRVKYNINLIKTSAAKIISSFKVSSKT